MTELVKYDAACRAISDCKSVDEVKEIHDQAAAMKAYARIAKNRRAEADWAAVRKRAERRLGQMMGAQKETVGTNKGGRPKTGFSKNPVLGDDVPATLAEAGIGKNLADRSRKAAAVQPEQFEQIIQETQDDITSAVVRGDRKIAAAAAGKRSPRKTRPPLDVYGTFAELDANFGAASRETQYKLGKKYPVEMAAAGLDGMAAGQRKAFLAERGLVSRPASLYRANGRDREGNSYR